MPNIFDLIESAASKTNALLELAKRFGRPELQLKISDLELELSTLKAAVAELNDENLQLKNRLHEKITSPLTLKDGIYHDTNGNTYCPACYGSPYERIPLKTLNQQGSWTLYSCPVCKERYQAGSPPPGTGRGKGWDPQHG
jgi:hypothetical protein